MLPKQSVKKILKNNQTDSNSENDKVLEFDPKPKLYLWKETSTVANITFKY